MGSFDEITGNPFTPFTINYKYDEPERAFRAETKKCNESYPVSIWIWFGTFDGINIQW